MSMKKYVLMARDECGDDFRAYGTDFLEAVYEFPSFNADDEAMREAFITWKNVIVERAQKEWAELRGDECYLFLERQYSDMSCSEWRTLGFGSPFDPYG